MDAHLVPTTHFPYGNSTAPRFDLSQENSPYQSCLSTTLDVKEPYNIEEAQIEETTGWHDPYTCLKSKYKLEDKYKNTSPYDGVGDYIEHVSSFVHVCLKY